MGMGIHGERGVWQGPLLRADQIADEMVERLLADLAPSAALRLAMLVNSLGATPLEELLILQRRITTQIRSKGHDVVLSWTGPYATSMEMAGASLSLLVLDDELEGLLREAADCPFWRAA